MAHRPYSCGLDAAVDVIGGKWKPLILWELHAGFRRFGELRRGVEGISEKMLIQQLREMEGDGIVHREVYREVPPRVEYSLTDLGESLNTALLPLGDWGEEHLPAITARRRGESKGHARPSDQRRQNRATDARATGTAVP